MKSILICLFLGNTIGGYSQLDSLKESTARISNFELMDVNTVLIRYSDNRDSLNNAMDIVNRVFARNDYFVGDALLYRAELKFLLGDRPGGLADIAQVIDSDTITCLKFDCPSSAYGKRGYNRLINDEFEDALVDLNKSLALSPDYGPTLGHKAHCLRYLKEYEKAIVIYNEVIDEDFVYEQLHYGRGVCYMQLSKYISAVADFTKCLDEDPRYGEALLKRAYSLIQLDYDQMDNFNFAMEDLDKLVQLYPKASEVYYYRGDLWKNHNPQGNPRNLKAIENYKKAIELDSEYMLAHYHLAVCYSNLGSYNEAIKHFGKVLELEPMVFEAYFGRGKAKVESASGDLAHDIYRSAEKDLNQSISMHADNQEYYYYRAQARFHMKEYDGCLSDCNMVLEWSGNENKSISSQVDLIYWRASALFEVGFPTTACEAWLTIEPYSEDARLKLKEHCNKRQLKDYLAY